MGENIYRESRKRAHESRAEAAGNTGISYDRLDRIERLSNVMAAPEEVIALATEYRDPALCNRYCTKECPIGKKQVLAVTRDNLAEIVLELVSASNVLDEKRNRLIDISADGKISDSEMKDFRDIKKTLDRISAATSALDFWVQKKILDGEIDERSYKIVEE